ncbi:phasin family protein [Halomonas sp. SH5A2]|uniref:phasin family protein n=1 Tax=Halomonas sp. SH5A2 TaxID=2749040 RepID=UPI0016408131|nr:phasin family protein [Halomonas sp. SH5A2]QNI02783.1 phasin family protein [Halomonas sp. SH5A2]
MSTEKTSKDSDKNAENATGRAKDQANNSVVEPARAYGTLMTDYYEQLFSTQFDAVREFADKSLAQSRSWLDVKDSESFQKVAEEQQQTIREMGERLKEDTQKINALSQQYLKESQQLASESMQKGKGHIEDSMQKSKEDLDDTHQKGQQQADKSKSSKSASATSK